MVRIRDIIKVIFGGKRMQETKKPLVSIIVPVYNVEAYLRRCLDSLINQTYQNLEIILVDDGSTDNSPAICDEYAAKDGRVRVFHKENGGVSSARNLGLDKMTGEWVSFVDSDDYLHLQFVEVFLSEAEKNEADIVACGFKMVYAMELLLEKIADYRTKTGSYLSCFQNGEDIQHFVCAHLFKKVLFDGSRFDSRLSYGEDTLIKKNMLSGNENARICYIDQPMYYYYSRPGSAVNTVSAEKLLAVVKVNFEWFSKLENKNPTKIFYGKKMIEELNRYRYMSTFSDDKPQVRKVTKEHFIPVYNYVKKMKAYSVKEAFILRAVYYFPIIYRVQHLLVDKMWVQWEKEQRQLKKERRTRENG